MVGPSGDQVLVRRVGEGPQALARVVTREGALAEPRLAREGLVGRQVGELEHALLDRLQRLAAQ